MLKTACHVLVVALCLHGTHAGAGQPGDERGNYRGDAHGDNAGSMSLLLENDAFAARDYHYTNGLQLSYLTPPRRGDSVAGRIARWLPGNGDGEVRVGWQFGQTVFTPEDKDSVALVPDERPYAAWLYGGVSIVYSDAAHIDTWSLLVGAVGPDAQGEALQRAVHKWLDVTEPRGWANQVGNRIGSVVIAERKWRALAQTSVLRFGADFMPHVGISLGNVATHANAGLTVRVGNGLENDFGPPRIRPSLPGCGYFVPHDEWAWYLFAGVDARFVERNILLDDNDLESLLTIDKENWVTDIQAGLVLTRGDFRMAYTYVHRSKEFVQQSEPDRFGSLGFTWRF